ncbi:MAG: hypothetical protein MZV64_18865 [Ignavibacteriales bacterium]|nr:hypothetical protein [Ignavibacteriales bacterium]
MSGLVLLRADGRLTNCGATLLVTDLVQAVNESGRVIGIICRWRADRHLRKDRGRTKKPPASLGIKDDLVNAGATWVDEAAFRDGNQVSGVLQRIFPHFAVSLWRLL